MPRGTPETSLRCTLILERTCELLDLSSSKPESGSTAILTSMIFLPRNSARPGKEVATGITITDTVVMVGFARLPLVKLTSRPP